MQEIECGAHEIHPRALILHIIAAYKQYQGHTVQHVVTRPSDTGQEIQIDLQSTPTKPIIELVQNVLPVVMAQE